MSGAVYEFEFFETEEDAGWILVQPFDFEGATEGQTMDEAAHMACDFLRTWMELWFVRGETPPTPTYGNKPRHPGGRIVLVAADDPAQSIRKMLPVEAARVLGVSAARVNQLIADKKLDSFIDDYGKRWVTAYSVEARVAERPGAGRPATAQTVKQRKRDKPNVAQKVAAF